MIKPNYVTDIDPNRKTVDHYFDRLNTFIAKFYWHFVRDTIGYIALLNRR